MLSMLGAEAAKKGGKAKNGCKAGAKVLDVWLLAFIPTLPLAKPKAAVKKGVPLEGGKVNGSLRARSKALPQQKAAAVG